MSEPSSPRGVAFPSGDSASSLLHRLLLEAAGAFPSAFEGRPLPADPGRFKKTYAQALLAAEQGRFEAGRGEEIARHIAEGAQRALAFVADDGARVPLTELPTGAPLDLAEPAGARGSGGWRPAVPFDGETFEGGDLGHVVDTLEQRHHVDREMGACLRRALARLDGDGRLDLTGERFALLGAGAEIAPTRHLLEAGATVLWCDVVEPPEDLLRAPGRLVHARGRSDLLSVPDRVLGTVTRFAEAEGPVHLGLFAYGPGRGREWRLTGAMNAIARRLPQGALRSVGLYVSPTSPLALTPEQAEVVTQRLAQPRLWQTALTATSGLTRNRSLGGGRAVADVVVPIQGVSYQAAQWVEKRLAAEALAADRPDLRVSANVAPITETRSLEHPVFRAAFRGAPAFGVQSFPAAFTRTLSALAYVEDVTGDDAAVRAKHLHGGVFTLAYSLESAIRVAAARGLLGPARLRT